MASLSEATVEVLSGIVGPLPARMCLSAASLDVGKSHEALGVDDFDAVANRIRNDMGRFASPDLIEHALEDIRARL
jgi:hypothetical protein